MKKYIFLFILAVLSFIASGQNITIDKGIFKVEYSQQYRSPLTVTYKLYKPKSKVSREGESFYHEKGIQTAGDVDYKDNVYDKGHMAAAETFSDTKAHIHATFSYVNCAVQHYKLNRGVWKSLEEKERQWAQQDSLLVINRVIFNQPLHPMKTGAFIPDYFEKEIKFLSTGIVRKYRFPNTEPASNDIDDYVVQK